LDSEGSRALYKLSYIETVFKDLIDGKVKAIIPFKKEGAKSRLGHFLTESEREEFALRMLIDVLGAIAESKLEEVEIITTCPKSELIEELKLHEGVDLISRLTVRVREDKRGLNELLNDVIGKEEEPVLIIMADIPLATSRSINELIEHEDEVVIAPGRKGGTNALFLRRPYDFSVSYYGISCAEHVEMAKRRKLSYAVYDSFFISTDIDEIDDLIEVLIHGKGFSAAYLRSKGIVLHVDKNLQTRALIERS